MTFRLYLVLLTLALALSALACSSTPTPTESYGSVVGELATSTAAPSPIAQGAPGECGSEWYPSEEDSEWVLAGTNSLKGDYTETHSVIESRDDGFTVRQTTSMSDVSFELDYQCTDAGLIMLNPAAQFGVASAAGPDGSATVNVLAASGLTLPFDLYAGESWQQHLAYEAVGGGFTIHGEYTADSLVRGVETITVPLGTFDAMRVDPEFQVSVEGEAWEACTATTWFVKGIGGIKSESSCLGTNDSNELVSFDSP